MIIHMFNTFITFNIILLASLHMHSQLPSHYLALNFEKPVKLSHTAQFISLWSPVNDIASSYMNVLLHSVLYAG